MKIKGNFTRTPPAPHTEDLALGWFAISHRWVDEKIDRRKEYGQLYKIESPHGSTYRTLRFSPRLKGGASKGEGQMLIDWQAWLSLCEYTRERDPVEVHIRPANIFEVFYHSMKHPDPAYRHSMAVARVGLYIAIISLLVSFRPM